MSVSKLVCFSAFVVLFSMGCEDDRRYYQTDGGKDSGFFADANPGTGDVNQDLGARPICADPRIIEQLRERVRRLEGELALANQERGLCAVQHTECRRTLGHCYELLANSAGGGKHCNGWGHGRDGD